MPLKYELINSKTYDLYDASICSYQNQKYTIRHK